MSNAITDFNQFTALRLGAEQNDPEVLREVAGQFEALFVQTMLKNMREASLGDPLMGDSNQYEMYQGMLDQQLALEMSSGRGMGLAEMLVRQLSGAAQTGAARSMPAPQQISQAAALPRATWQDAEAFARDVWPHAERVANRLNVPTEAIVAQAALETGWGAHVPQRGDGSSSFNLFGIKAGQNWSGSRVIKTTLEFANGLPQPELASFRAYDNVAATFDDYSALMLDNPRYAAVRGHGDDVAAFANALQASGYATDPAYADKLLRVADSEIMQRAVHKLKSSASAPISERQLSNAI